VHDSYFEYDPFDEVADVAYAYQSEAEDNFPEANEGVEDRIADECDEDKADNKC